jgi:hypothetical protein
MKVASGQCPKCKHRHTGGGGNSTLIYCGLCGWHRKSWKPLKPKAKAKVD